MCKVYTGYCGTSEIEHGLCACTVDNPLAKARGLSLRTGAQTMLYLSLIYQIDRVLEFRLRFDPYEIRSAKVFDAIIIWLFIKKYFCTRRRLNFVCPQFGKPPFQSSKFCISCQEL